MSFFVVGKNLAEEITNGPAQLYIITATTRIFQSLVMLRMNEEKSKD